MIKRITEKFTPKQYFIQFLLVLTALFGVYLIIAWSTYSPFDSAWTVSANHTQIVNKAGIFGAWMIDVLFMLLGKVANLVPFIVLVTPIYVMYKQHSDNLTWLRFIVRLTGFLLLLGGLSIGSSLWLGEGVNSLAGGVLGALLTENFLPSLGMFGMLLLAVAATLSGLIMFSGFSLLHLSLKFYNWLTCKNEDSQLPLSTKENEIATDNNSSEVLTEKEDKPILTPQAISALVKSSVTPSSVVEQEKTTTINITGLTVNHIYDGSEPTQTTFGGFHTSDNDALPQVTLHQQNDSSDWKYQYTQPNEELPAVTLAPLKTTENPTALSAHISSEAESFAGREQQEADEIRHEKQIVAENTVKISLNVLPEEKKEIEIANGKGQTPNYRPYEQSLIHPLLQPKTTASVKPTSPLPSLELLDRRPVTAQDITQEEIVETSKRIEQQLHNFNIKASVKDVLVGPVVTRYELELQPGVKASKVTGIDSDLARALMFRSIRVAEVIPGKPYIGIETPNDHRQTVSLRDVLESDEFRYSNALLPLALGKDISGKAVVIDLAKTPHLLVAGSTGSGKSVGINTMILSLLYKVKPETVKFIMIDPKVVELSIYNGIPHLLTEVVTDMKKAANALRWCVDEMERRYQLLSHLRVRNIEGYNEKIDEAAAMNLPIPDPSWRPGDSMDTMPPALEKLSYIVVIVDEFADLMMVAGKQIEELIARLTQKARAIGIHVILATQRPSVDVITGLIKSNIPSRIAFTVVQRNDSRTILDQNGAEALLGRGDMLYLGNGTTDLVRIHGAFMSDDEVVRVADDWRARGKPQYIHAILENADDENSDDFITDGSEELDPMFDRAVEVVLNSGQASKSFIQRRLKVGFNRASNIIDQLEERGIVSKENNGKREVLISHSEY